MSPNVQARIIGLSYLNMISKSAESLPHDTCSHQQSEHAPHPRSQTRLTSILQMVAIWWLRKKQNHSKAPQVFFTMQGLIWNLYWDVSLPSYIYCRMSAVEDISCVPAWVLFTGTVRSQTLYQTATLGMGLGTWPYQICSAAHILQRSITVSKLLGIALLNHKWKFLYVSATLSMLSLSIMGNLW